MKFYFLRHPETIANKKGLIYGWTDYDYTEKGREMMEEMPERIARLSFDKIYASPLGRAKKLADAISERTKIPVIEDDRIKEMNFGMLEGLDFFEARKSHGDILDKLFSDYDGFTVPQGESSLDVKKRAMAFLDEIKEEDGACLLVTHAMFIHTAMSYLLQLDPHIMWKFKIEPCMVVCVEYREGFSVMKSMVPFEETDGFFIVDKK